jgi:hypothetical protein
MVGASRSRSLLAFVTAVLLCAAHVQGCLIKKLCQNSEQCKDLIAANSGCSIDWKEAAW